MFDPKLNKYEQFSPLEVVDRCQASENLNNA